MERSLSLYIVQKGYMLILLVFLCVTVYFQLVGWLRNWVVIGFVIVCHRDLARWRCFRTDCNWAEQVIRLRGCVFYVHHLKS